MINTIGRLKGVTTDWKSGKMILSIEIDGKPYNDLNKFSEGYDLSVKIGKYHQSKSDAQRKYAWELLTQLAEAQRPPISKDKMYEDMLFDYGQTILLPMIEAVEPGKLFDYYREKGRRTAPDGTVWIDWIIAIGMSKYNTKDMTILLDGIIQECEQVGIDTRTPDEVARMNQWGA